MSEQVPITYTSLDSLNAHGVCAPLNAQSACASLNAQSAYTSLEKDVLHLKECMDIMQETVQMQQPAINSIEDAIHSSQEDAKRAQQEMIKADAYQSRYQYMMTIVGSAVVGIATLVFIL